MSRIKLQLPSHFSFSTKIPVRITDLNYGGHVGNDTILSLIHEARMQFLKQYNYTELELEGTSLIMSDAGIEFKAEVFYNDVLTFYVVADNFSRVSFDLYYKVVKEPNETIVAIAKTGMVFYDYNARKVVGVPGRVREKLNPLTP
ncbi:MAG: acyl-CoA thioesterase [Flavisolibacter sp.]